MIMKHLKSIILFALVLIAGWAAAQTQTPDLEIDTRSTGSVMVCGEALQFTVEIRNASGGPIDNVKLYPQMPAGMAYVIGSAQSMTELSTDDPANPLFLIGSLPDGNPRTVYFQAKANCALIANLKSQSSNVIKNETKVTYTRAGSPGVIEIPEPNGSDSYSVLYPELELFMPDNEKNQGAPFINKVLNRHITVKNSGLGRLSTMDFYLKAEAELTVDKLELVTASGNVVVSQSPGDPALGRKYVITDFSGAGNGDAFLDEGEEIQLVDYVKANTSKGAIETVYTAQWGCLGIPCNPDDLQAQFIAYVQAIGGDPSKLEISHEVLSATDFCGSPATVRWSFKNPGSGNAPESRDGAFNVHFQLTHVSPLTTDDYHFYIQHADGTRVPIDDLLEYTESHLSPYYYKRYIFKFTDALSLDPDGAGGLDDVDGDGYFDDLPVGNTVRFVMVALSTLGTQEAYTFNYDFSESISFEKWSGLRTGYGVPSRGIEFRALSQNMIGTVDLVHGKRETVRFELKEAIDFWLLKQLDAVFHITLQVPQGVLIRSAKWNGKFLNWSQNGNTVTIVDPLLRYPFYTDIDFEYDLDCTKAEPGVLVGETKLDMVYYFDKDCSASFKVASVTKEIFLHCGSCTTVETTLFRAERKTLGWVYPSQGTYRYKDLYTSSATRAKKVNPNTPGIRLDAAYPKDSVEVTLQGRVVDITATNLKAEIRYTAPMQREVLHYLSSTLLIGNNKYEIPLSNVSQTHQDSTYKYTINIPLGTAGFPTQIASRTSFEVKAMYRVDAFEDVARGEYPMSDFRGQVYTTINGNPTPCLDFGDDFVLFRPHAFDASNTGTSASLSETGRLVLSHFSFQYGNKNYGYSIPDFPGEFRPVLFTNTQTVTLPKGYIFDDTQPVGFSVGTPGPNNVVSLPGATFSPDRRTVTIPFGPNTPVIVDPSGYFFVASVKIDCVNPDNLFVPTTALLDRRGPLRNDHSIVTDVYLSLHEEHVAKPVITSSGEVYNYRRPSLQLTANSIQEGYRETVTWPVQLCNPNTGADKRKSLHTWVAFELKSDDQSTVLREVLDENGNPFPTENMIFYGPKDATRPKGRNLLVRLDTIELTSCITMKVVAAYTNCQEDTVQDIDVYTSWDYVDYPLVDQNTVSVLNHKASCEGYVLAETMTIKYKTADLQWEVRKNGPEEVDLCTATPFEIDLASTRYGDMRDLKLSMEFPPLAVLDPAQPAQFHYPYNAAPVPVPDDAITTVGSKTVIDVSKLIGGNLPGIYSNDNKVKLAFNVTTSCGFDPGMPIKYTLTGATNCGDRVEFADQRRIRLAGVGDNLDSLALTLSAPQALACSSENDISLQIKNLGDDLSKVSQLEVTLPAGTEFREMVASADLPAPLKVTTDGLVKLRWTLPAGYLAADAAATLTIRTFLHQTPVGTTSVPFKARTYVTADGHCAESTEPCNMEVTFAQHELSVPVTGLTSLSIDHKRYICTYQFMASVGQVGDCSVSMYSWSFGDGGTSTQAMPFHSFGAAGTYTVSLNVNFNCGGCNGTQTKQMQLVVTPDDAIWKDTTITVLTEIKKQVLQVSASTFSDSWPTQHVDPALENRHSFDNGTLGVWRNDGSFVYETERKASVPVNIAKDGTFDLKHFNWQYADLGAIPGWIKANAMTQYSPFSYELENRDVLGIYSSALYDYGGHLPSANGVNMRNAEMAFTSFEFSDSTASGNWMFGAKPAPAYYLYPVNVGLGNVAIVEASLKDLENVSTVDVSADGFIMLFLYPFKFNHTANNEIVCRMPYEPNPDWSVIVLRDAPHAGLWKGRIKVTNEVVPVVAADIDNTMAHSGNSSMKVFGAARTFRQELLQLDSGKRYVISAWVRAKNADVKISTQSKELGFDIMVRNSRGQAVLSHPLPFLPEGRIIEGWQQVKGTFTYPGGKRSTLEITFKPGGTTNTAWYDDLRLHPEQGNMKSYVYDLKDYRLRAILDEENFASFYYYDAEGNLHLVKKETEDGIKTISENVSSLNETGANK